MPEIRDRRNPPPASYRTAAKALDTLADHLRLQCGDRALLSALLSTYLNRALTHGDADHVRRMLVFTLENLEEIERIHTDNGKLYSDIVGTA
jgi:hypothetical protein